MTVADELSRRLELWEQISAGDAANAEPTALEVLQFRLWAEQRGCRGDGEPPGPPKLCDLTGHAPAKTITPLYSTDYLFVSFSVRAEKCNSPRCLR